MGGECEIFREIKDAINSINYVKGMVDKIQRNLECKYIRKGYDVKALIANQSIAPAQVSFELNYHDWLQLEKSNEWKAFVKLLRERQDECSLMLLQERQDSQGITW